MSFVNVLIQIVDFLFKAAVHYVETDAGKKEWSDIETAYEVATNNADNPGVEYAVTNSGEAAPKRILRN